MKNEYKITKELMMSWAREYFFRGPIDIILFVLWIIVGAFGVGSLVVLAIIGGHWLECYISILFILLSVFKLFISRFIVMSNRYKMHARTYGVSEWIRTIEFTEDEIIFTDHTTIIRFPYDIKKVVEKNNSVVVFFNNNSTIRFYKDSFVEGTWEECKKFISNKTTK